MELKTGFSLLFSLLLAGSAMAIPAKPGLKKIKQPDGTEITVRLYGDERLNWFETEDGYKLLRNDKNFIVYAVNNENGDLVPSNTIYRENNVNSQIMKSNLNISKDVTFSNAQIMKAQQRAPYSTESNAIFPREGKCNLLMLLVNFSDTKTTVDRQVLDNMMNQEGYNEIGSFRDYMLEASDGKLDITTTVTDWINISKPHDYFKYNQYRPNTYELILEALALIDEQYDFKKFDNDNDGFIDGIMVVHQGTGQESSGNQYDIWSHSSTLEQFEPSASKRTFDGKVFNAYTVEPELVKDSSGDKVQTTVGVFCHEFTHNLGAPDYYDTTDSGWNGTGNWDLMASGSWNGNHGDRPAMINAFQRILFGWLPEPETLTEDIEVKDFEATINSKKVYKLETNDDYDYFLLENRQQSVSKFDAAVPASGLLIYHINQKLYEAKEPYNSINTTSTQSVYVVAASSTQEPGKTPSTYGNIDNQNAIFGSKYKGFNNYTTPGALSWKKEYAKGQIFDITQNNGKISFNFYIDKSFTLKNINGEGNGIENKFRFIMDGPTIDMTTFKQYNVYSKTNGEYENIGTIKSRNYYDISLPEEKGEYTYSFELVYDNGEKDNKVDYTFYLPEECVTSVSVSKEGEGSLISWKVDESKKNISETKFKEFKVYRNSTYLGSTTETTFKDDKQYENAEYIVLSVWENGIETSGKSNNDPETSIEETMYSNNGNVVSCSYDSSSSNVICNMHCNREGANATVEVYDMTGQRIAAETLTGMTEGANVVNVNCSGANKGVYIVTVKTVLGDSREQFSEKVVIL